jgi:hypothetical protein
VTAPIYVDVTLPAGVSATIPVPAGHAGFVYPFEGDVVVSGDANDRALARGELGVLTDGASVTLRGGESGGRALVVAGKPLGEPIAQHGPFVMNTAAEIEQAIRDYQAGRF